MELKDAIRHNYLVRGLSYGEIAAIVDIAEPKTYREGEEIVRRNDPSTDLMIVCDGIARVVADGGEKIADLGPGRVFGEIALVDNAPRSATVLSAGRTTVAVISSKKLRALIDDQPNIELVLLRNISKVLCDHIRRNNVELERCYSLLGGD